MFNIWSVGISLLVCLLAATLIFEGPKLLSDRKDDPATRDLELGALHNLAPELNHGPNSVAFELGFGSEQALNEQRDRIQRVRERVSSMPDARMRGAYEKWINFYQRENDEARAEMVSGVKRKAWLEYKARDAEERKKIDATSQTTPKP